MVFFYFEYSFILCFLFISFILAVIIFFASFLFGSQFSYLEKLSAYECGFDPFEDARNQFDVRFYLVAILFLLFDLEASFLFPWVTSLSNISSFGFWTILDFLVELVVGFIYVWKIGALEWELYFR